MRSGSSIRDRGLPVSKRLAFSLVLLLCGAAVAVGLADGRAVDVGGKSELERISTPGAPVPVSSLSARDLFVLHSVRAVGHVRRIGISGEVAYYLADGEDGGTCVLSGWAGNHEVRFGSAGCQAAGAFPSDELPIFDRSGFRQEIGSPDVHLDALGGVAADGVASVGVVDPSGEYVSAPVRGNVYWMRPAGDVEARELVAKDRSGRIVYSFPLTP